MKVHELLRRLGNVSPSADVFITYGETVQLSDVTWGTEDREEELHSVIDLETKIHLAAEP